MMTESLRSRQDVRGTLLDFRGPLARFAPCRVPHGRPLGAPRWALANLFVQASFDAFGARAMEMPGGGNCQEGIAGRYFLRAGYSWLVAPDRLPHQADRQCLRTSARLKPRPISDVPAMTAAMGTAVPLAKTPTAPPASAPMANWSMPTKADAEPASSG